MANKFVHGDVVVMKSGGPPMTVAKVPGDPTYDGSSYTISEYACEWFKGATAQKASFAEHLLIAYVPPK